MNLIKHYILVYILGGRIRPNKNGKSTIHYIFLEPFPRRKIDFELSLKARAGLARPRTVYHRASDGCNKSYYFLRRQRDRMIAKNI